MADPNPPPVAPPIVDKALVKSGLADGSILLLDVRNLAQGEGKIPGSKNLPFDSMPSSFHLPPSEFESRFGFPPLKKADPIVTHCGKGGRATKAAKALTGEGFTDVRIFLGGFKEWSTTGEEVEGFQPVQETPK